MTTTKTLPLDVSRCAGRMDFGPNAQRCEQRETCQRYLAFTQWDQGIDSYRGIPVYMAVPECGMKIEVEPV